MAIYAIWKSGNIVGARDRASPIISLNSPCSGRNFKWSYLIWASKTWFDRFAREFTINLGKLTNTIIYCDCFRKCLIRSCTQTQSTSSFLKVLTMNHEFHEYDIYARFLEILKWYNWSNLNFMFQLAFSVKYRRYLSLQRLETSQCSKTK